MSHRPAAVSWHAANGPGLSSTAARTFFSVRSWRSLLVSLHVISSVCWLGQALALVALLTLSASSPPGETKIAAASMAVELDLSVLGFSALIAAFTGFGLAAVTTWGYFHHWWVSTKFVLTTAQLAVGTLVLAQALPTVVAAARTGTDGAAVPVAIGLGLVAGGLALQVWLSVTKPGGRTPRGQKAQSRLTTAPVTVIAMTVVLPLIDIALHVVTSLPLPVLTPIGLIVALVVRRRRGRLAAGTGTADPGRVVVTPATVISRQTVAPGVVALRLRPVDHSPTPMWEPGAHIDLHLPSGRVRQYSLYGDPCDRDGYNIAVLLEPAGRGGSREIHQLQDGSPVGIGGPRNNFPLAPAAFHILIAGGIGITPLIPMMKQLDSAGAPWQLFYRGRSHSAMPFADELATRYPDRAQILPSDTTARPDLATVLAALPPGSAVYCCGPDTLMNAVTQAMTTACPHSSLHIERFTATVKDDSTNRAFQVVLPHAGATIDVPADRGMLECLRQVLPDVPASCETGLCGSCAMRVLAGRPEHRDDILQGAARETHHLVYPCVSRSLDNLLVIDA